ncbi:MAG: hypothetical protein KDE09_19245, partial [Anaerolineales bacterium]|nr:hypothetical protein [Anaerolineales bacterium]
ESRGHRLQAAAPRQLPTPPESDQANQIRPVPLQTNNEGNNRFQNWVEPRSPSPQIVGGGVFYWLLAVSF